MTLKTRKVTGKRNLRLAAILTMFVMLVPATAQAGPAYVESFEVGADDWYDYADGTVQLDHALAPLGSSYAPDAMAATGLGFARMGFDDCTTTCYGPYTWWGGAEEEFPKNGYSTSIKFYLDMDYAAANPDARVDWSSGISRSDTGLHLRDFIFNFGTDPDGDGTWVVSGSNNGPGWPSNPNNDPVTVTETGWYTFQHVFTEDNGFLHTRMTLEGADGTTFGTWDKTGVDDIDIVGGNLYGWLVRSDIEGIAFDDAIKLDCTPIGAVAGLGC